MDLVKVYKDGWFDGVEDLENYIEEVALTGEEIHLEKYSTMDLYYKVLKTKYLSGKVLTDLKVAEILNMPVEFVGYYIRFSLRGIYMNVVREAVLGELGLDSSSEMPVLGDLMFEYAVCNKFMHSVGYVCFLERYFSRDSDRLIELLSEGYPILTEDEQEYLKLKFIYGYGLKTIASKLEVEEIYVRQVLMTAYHKIYIAVRSSYLGMFK